MNTNIYKAVSNEKNGKFHLYLEFETDTFVLKVLQNGSAWSSQINKTNLESLAGSHGLNCEEYYKKLKWYFMQSSEEVEPSFCENKFTLNILLNNGMKFVYFSCPLSEISFADCVMIIIDQTYASKCQTEEKLIKVIQNERSHEERIAALENKLTEFIDKKRADEDEMYSNFLAIVNEKKTEIQHLNELLIAFKRGRPTLNPVTVVKRRSSKKTFVKTNVKQEINENSDSSSNQDDNRLDVNYNTDDEKERMLLHTSSDEEDEKISSPVPSNSKQNLNFLSDDSPTHYNLPKRLKLSDEPKLELNISEPSTSKIDNYNKEPKKELPSENSENKCTAVDFNTQDLLDNI